MAKGALDFARFGGSEVGFRPVRFSGVEGSGQIIIVIVMTIVGTIVLL